MAALILLVLIFTWPFFLPGLMAAFLGLGPATTLKIFCTGFFAANVREAWNEVFLQAGSKYVAMVKDDSDAEALATYIQEESEKVKSSAFVFSGVLTELSFFFKFVVVAMLSTGLFFGFQKGMDGATDIVFSLLWGVWLIPAASRAGRVIEETFRAGGSSFVIVASWSSIFAIRWFLYWVMFLVTVAGGLFMVPYHAVVLTYTRCKSLLALRAAATAVEKAS